MPYKQNCRDLRTHRPRVRMGCNHHRFVRGHHRSTGLLDRPASPYYEVAFRWDNRIHCAASASKNTLQDNRHRCFQSLCHQYQEHQWLPHIFSSCDPTQLESAESKLDRLFLCRNCSLEPRSQKCHWFLKFQSLFQMHCGKDQLCTFLYKRHELDRLARSLHKRCQQWIDPSLSHRFLIQCTETELVLEQEEHLGTVF